MLTFSVVAQTVKGPCTCTRKSIFTEFCEQQKRVLFPRLQQIEIEVFLFVGIKFRGFLENYIIVVTEIRGFQVSLTLIFVVQQNHEIHNNQWPWKYNDFAVPGYWLAKNWYKQELKKICLCFDHSFSVRSPCFMFWFICFYVRCFGSQLRGYERTQTIKQNDILKNS